MQLKDRGAIVISSMIGKLSQGVDHMKGAVAEAKDRESFAGHPDKIRLTVALAESYN